jgi:putative phage-type endonuclease
LVLSAAAPRDVWLRARMKGLGSSDVASVLGVGRKSPLYVYHIKVGEIMEDSDDDELALWGNLHEETVSREWARRNKSVVRRIGLVAHVGIPWQMCTLDRLVVECPLDRTARNQCALEVKTRDKAVASRWKNGVPEDVEAQVRWQMIVNGFDHMHVACLIGGNDYRQYTVRADPHLHQNIAQAAGDFWTCVLNRQPPPEGDSDPMYDQLNKLDNRLHPNRAGSKFLNDRDALAVVEWLKAYNEAASTATTGRKLKERAKYELLRLLGPTHDAAVADNKCLFTYDEVDRPRKVDYDMLEERWPEAYEACVTRPTSRTLVIKWKPPTEEEGNE